jgi:hypothetical protein
MTIDERIEALIKMQESHEANLDRLFELSAQSFELHAKNETALARSIQHTDETFNRIARILEIPDKRISDLEGGV